MDREEQRPGETEENVSELSSMEKGPCSISNIIAEVKRQLWLAVPLVLANFLQFCLQTISVMFVGHLGELALSGASMATSFAAVTGFDLLIGMASALDTFCGQSYGAEQYHMLGIHTQRAMFVLLFTSTLVAFIWANTGHVLLAFGQDPDIAAEAGVYARFMIPSLFAYGLLQCNIGAAIANSISYWINVALLSLYVKFSPSCKNTWTGFSKEALHGVLKFLWLAIPSAVMVCLEMWTFELMVLLSGLLPNPKLETSVLSISLNTSALVWMIPSGLAGSVSTRVSNELGAGNPQAARLAVLAVLSMATTEGILVGMTMILLRKLWGFAYSNEKEVAKYVASMMPILALSNFLDGIQCVLSGTARGCGWQKIGAFINLGAYYLVGVPSAIVLAFVLHIGGKGLWFGIICALCVQVLALLIVTFQSNWEEEAKKAIERVSDSMIPNDVDS